jgi:hypothetical protein
MRKRLLLLALFLLAVAVAVPFAARRQAVAERLARSRLIDREHCDRIKKGMTQAEVEALLGGPPGDFTTKELIFLGPTSCMLVAGERREYWAGDRGMLEVSFNEADGTVVAAFLEEPLRLPELSLIERVRRWLRRLWP